MGYFDQFIHSIWAVSLAVLLLNLPFGYWRAGTRRLSLHWFLAVHSPVPAVATLRILSGIGWQWTTFPVLVLAYFTGQFVGGRLRPAGDPGTSADSSSSDKKVGPTG